MCMEACRPGPEATWPYQCLHRVHAECAEGLLRSRSGRTCPICRAVSRDPGQVLNESSEEGSSQEDIARLPEDEFEDEGITLLGLILNAFHDGSQARRELGWSAVLSAVNVQLRERDSECRFTPAEFLSDLAELEGSSQVRRSPDGGTALLLPGELSLLLPGHRRVVAEPPQQREVPQWKIDMLVQAATAN